MLLQKRIRPSEPKHETIACESCASSTTSASSEEEIEAKGEREEQSCGYYYMQMPPPMPSPHRDFGGWDFFNPFDSVRTEVISGYRRSLDDDLRVVREEEGIPELEEEGDREELENKVVNVEEHEDTKHESCVETSKVVDSGNENQVEQKGFNVMDPPGEGRELLEALKDIEDHFMRAYDSGKDVSRMLEANRVHIQSGLQEIKENSTKLIQAITWHRSTLSRPSSGKSLMASSTKNSSTWMEYRNDLFDDYGGMDSGSHSLTLGRMYAWEKKLYEEVKAGDSTRKIYERKCSRLRNQDVRGDDELSLDKTRASVKDLYARILVAIRSAESISKRIQKLRDEELQPQIVELLKGLTRTWKVMLECHETQNKILLEVKSFNCPTYGKFCNESHRLATLQLDAELQNWRSCFTEYAAAQKGYIEALHGWLSKFIVPEVEFYSKSKNMAVPYQVSGPPLLVICHDWLDSMQKLPDKMVSLALKAFLKDMKVLLDQQEKEQQQKRKVDSLAKNLDRRNSSVQNVESRMLEFNLTEQKPDSVTENRNECLMEKKDHLEMFRSKLDLEKEKHHNCMQETRRITLNGLQSGFSRVFESLTEFSIASQKMYNDLVTYSEDVEKIGNMSYIEDCQVKEDCSR
ncbi:Protein of unknown function (DUF630 and DUF632) [Quillaja saponaria]|uniref:DUF632 domain-containing protein n=1 Tax=Quillaja saponaria TaxID=32244 RepID=A0AAD7VJW9_QUISA|nr:Protein of unknown function (DUF630 and DUF632) [Quillaja saponaria]